MSLVIPSGTAAKPASDGIFNAGESLKNGSLQDFFLTSHYNGWIFFPLYLQQHSFWLVIGIKKETQQNQIQSNISLFQQCLVNAQTSVTAVRMEGDGKGKSLNTGAGGHREMSNTSRMNYGPPNSFQFPLFSPPNRVSLQETRLSPHLSHMQHERCKSRG